MATAQLLNEAISKNDTYCLNAASENPLANVWNADERFVLKSDADEQLIIHLTFNEKVNVTGISFCAPTDSETQPTAVKLYANRLNLGFDDIESYPESQALELTADDVKDDSVITALKIVKFRAVDSLTIFVAENAGSDVTVISSIKIFGTVQQGTKMGELKKVGEDGQ